MLDVPLKDKDDPPEKLAPNTSGSLFFFQETALPSGSPVHLVGDPSARVVYVIEGC